MKNNTSPMMEAGHKRKLFERDSGITISVVADGTFIVRARVIENNRGRIFVHTVSDMKSVLELVETALQSNVDKLEKIIVLDKEKMQDESTERRTQRIRGMQAEQKARYSELKENSRKASLARKAAE